MNIPGMRNRVYFPKYDLHQKQCVSYSFDEGKYHPRRPALQLTKVWEIQNEICPNQCLWIEPPAKNVFDSMLKTKGKKWKGKSIAL